MTPVADLKALPAEELVEQAYNEFADKLAELDEQVSESDYKAFIRLIDSISEPHRTLYLVSQWYLETLDTGFDTYFSHGGLFCFQTVTALENIKANIGAVLLRKAIEMVRPPSISDSDFQQALGDLNIPAFTDEDFADSVFGQLNDEFYEVYLQQEDIPVLLYAFLQKS